MPLQTTRLRIRGVMLEAMRISDWLIVLIGIEGASFLIRNRARRNWFLAMAGTAVVYKLAVEPTQWQMLPAFAAYLLLAVLFFVKPPAGNTDRRTPVLAAAAFAIFLCLSTAMLCWVLPMFVLPEPDGPYAVGTRTVQYVDPATGRPLVVQFWYPAERETLERRARYTRLREAKPLFAYESSIRTNSFADAPVAGRGELPVLLFNHMWAGGRTQDTFLTEELASYGYVVAAIDHPGNAARVELADGRVLRSTMANALSSVDTSTPAAIEALWSQELANWVQDSRFVLDRVQAANDRLRRADEPEQPDDFLHGRLDLTRVGAFGHSFGGAASMALLGADPRVRGAVNLDGWTFNGMDGRTTQPVLFVYEGSGQVRRPPVTTDAQLDRDDNAAIDASLARYGGERAFVAGTQHLDFTDRTLVSPLHGLTYTGPIVGARVRTIVRGLVLGFFDRTLYDGGSLPRYPEVTLETSRAQGRP